MSKYRDNLPQLNSQPFITDGGLETVLVFQKGIDLPEFAAYDMLRTDTGRQTLRDYYVEYINIAARYGYGILLEAPTWRAQGKRSSSQKARAVIATTRPVRESGSSIIGTVQGLPETSRGSRFKISAIPNP